MAATRPAVDQTHFSVFSPLDRLPPESAEELLAYTRVERVPPGRRLFHKGDSDGEVVFLLSGQLALIADGPAGTLKADAPEARLPVADHQPRRCTAVARTSATVLCVNAAVLDSLLRPPEEAAGDTIDEPAPGTDEPGTVDETEEAANAEADVETRTETVTAAGATHDVLHSPLIRGLPPAHLQILRTRMERLEVRRGETVIRQGEPCRYFHLVESGRFRAGRRRAQGAAAEFLPGDAFGEEALVVNEPHDATVTAVEDGSVLRLPRTEFLSLVARRHIKWIAYRDLPALLEGGRAVVLDIRPPAAYRRRHLRGSINFPLPLMNAAACTLDPARRYVLCCDNARRSVAAAFLLARHGVKAHILVEGIKAALRLE